jgi:hypothetical protein
VKTTAAILPSKDEDYEYANEDDNDGEFEEENDSEKEIIENTLAKGKTIPTKSVPIKAKNMVEKEEKEDEDAQNTTSPY